MKRSRIPVPPGIRKLVMYVILLVFLFSWLPLVQAYGTYHKENIEIPDPGPPKRRPETREEIMAQQFERRQRLEKALQKAKETVRKHESGEFVLDEKLLPVIQTRISTLERKVQQLGEPISEDKMEEMINAAKKYNLLLDVSASEKSEL